MRTRVKAGTPSAQAQPARVLIVDDEATIRQFLEQVLRPVGYVTATAASGQEAMTIAAEFHPDLLLTDLMMPRMTGDELARRLRLEEPDLKVLYLTGFADRLFTEKHVLWEYEAFLEKPATMGGVLEAVALLLNGHVHGAGLQSAGR